MSDTTFLILLMVIPLYLVVGLIQAQIQLLNKRIDHMWEYSRSLDRSLNAQHRLLTAICANLRIEPFPEENEEDS